MTQKDKKLNCLNCRIGDFKHSLCDCHNGFCAIYKGIGTQEDFFMAIEALSSNAMQVVQCKDCKHRETDDCPMYWEEWLVIEDCDGYADDKYVVHDYTTNNGYCHYGERK